MLVLKGLVKRPGEQMVALVWTRQPIEERSGEVHAPKASVTVLEGQAPLDRQHESTMMGA